MEINTEAARLRLIKKAEYVSCEVYGKDKIFQIEITKRAARKLMYQDTECVQFCVSSVQLPGDEKPACYISKSYRW